MNYSNVVSILQRCRELEQLLKLFMRYKMIMIKRVSHENTMFDSYELAHYIVIIPSQYWHNFFKISHKSLIWTGTFVVNVALSTLTIIS